MCGEIWGVSQRFPCAVVWRCMDRYKEPRLSEGVGGKERNRESEGGRDKLQSELGASSELRSRRGQCENVCFFSGRVELDIAM